MDESCLSYWLPKIAAAGLPVPRTEIICCEEAERLVELLDGNPESLPALDTLAGYIAAAAIRIGNGKPVFLRTGQTSNKHNWEQTCYLGEPIILDDIKRRIVNLVEFSMVADFIGLDVSVWVVREMLPVRPLFHAFRGRMPIVREFRCFANQGDVTCIHPYWPPDSIFSADREDWRSILEEASNLWLADRKQLQSLALAAAKAIGHGSWSVDCLWTDNGWYVTDMAVAAQSFHWPNCTTTFA